MKKRFSGPQIVAKLRQADKLLGQGKTVEEVCKEIEVTDATYYRWRQKYGGMSPDMVKQLRAVQKENAQLRKLVADQALDISILKVAAEGNFYSRLGDARLLTTFAMSWGFLNGKPVKPWASPAVHSGISPSCLIRISR